MKTMQQNWKRSLATFALLAAFNSPEAAVVAAEPIKPVAVPAATPRAPQPPVAGMASPVADPMAEDAFARRYGMMPGSGTVSRSSGQAESAKAGARLEAKLKGIILPEIKFDGLPLSEVIQFLSDQSRKLDPEKQGINFLINPNAPPSPPAPVQVDAGTGMPLPPAPVEQMDIANATVKFTLPLRNVTLKETLDAIAKVANMPVAYAVEDYAVVFSQQPEPASVVQVGRGEEPGSEPLQVRTFKVNTNAFLAGLENVFGIKGDLPANADRGARSRKFQSAMRDLLMQLGIPMSPRKAVFYNELTGMLMVRATTEDLETVNAAMELLGGTSVSSSAGAGGGGGGGGGGFGGMPAGGFGAPGGR